MKKLIILGMSLLVIGTLTGCSSQSTEETLQQAKRELSSKDLNVKSLEAQKTAEFYREEAIKVLTPEKETAFDELLPKAYAAESEATLTPVSSIGSVNVAYIPHAGSVEKLEHRVEQAHPTFNIDLAQQFLDNYGSKWRAEDFTHTTCKPEVLIAIACRETSCGKNMTTKNNIGNVNNNDGGNRVEMASFQLGVQSICSTLNNKYLGHTTQLWELSHSSYKKRTGSKPQFWYATDTSGTWASDIATFISKMTGKPTTIDYAFRNVL